MTGEWRSMESAPRDATEILVCATTKVRGVTALYVAHWAHDSSGEEQPSFGPGWFFWTGWSFHSLPATPSHWMPLPLKPGERAQL